MRNLGLIGIVGCLLITLLSGCGGVQNKVIDKNQSSTLKVMFFNEDYFYQQYGMLFNSLYPNINIEVMDYSIISTELMDKHNQNYEKALEEFINTNEPDVIVVDIPSAVASLSNKGILYELDKLVAEKSYNAEGLLPWTIETMKDIGLGKIYTLPTSYTSQVLYYNKDLFNQYNIPYPTDHMDWEDIFKIASQFPTNDNPSEKIYGLNMAWSKNLGEIVMQLSQAKGLKFFDSETLKMTINTPAWSELIEQALDMMKLETMFYNDMMYDNDQFQLANESITPDPFVNGRLAMKFESNHYLSVIENTQQYSSLIDNWDMVTAPVNPEKPNETLYSSFNSLVAINAASQNKEAAWTYISYITSDEFARVTSKIQYSDASLRTEYFHKDSEHNYEALYKLKPVFDSNRYIVSVPQRFLIEFDGIFQQALLYLAEGEMLIEEVLAELDLRGNELLATPVMTNEEYNKYLNEVDIPTIIFR